MLFCSTASTGTEAQGGIIEGGVWSSDVHRESYRDPSTKLLVGVVVDAGNTQVY